MVHMATAKKLPSGSWRIRAFDYTDTDGKKHYRSFTCDDPSAKGKRKCELMAAEWAAEKETGMHDSAANITLQQCLDNYVSSKENVLSPATIRGYKQMYSYFLSIKDIKITKINQKLVTQFINDLSKNHAPKTVRNAHGFLTAALRASGCNINWSTKLPQAVQPVYALPSDTDIKALMDYFTAHDKEMLIALYLAAFGTLRRSEICGLTADDVEGNVIHVHKALVKGQDGEYQQKTTKTTSSDRYITLPDFVVASFPESGRLVAYSPDAITRRMERALKLLNISPFRFHDLRHYSASIMHAIGVPDQYIMERGGWKSDKILKQVYRGTMSEYQKKYTQMTNDYFKNINQQ